MRTSKPFSVEVKTWYVKTEDPYSKFHDFFFLTVFNTEFLQDGENIWKGEYGNLRVTIVQHGRADVKESDVTVEMTAKDPNVSYWIPNKKDLARIVNAFLDQLYA